MTTVLHRPETAVAGAWRRVLVRSILLPGAVMAPLTTLALTGDHRFNVYWHGSTVAARPWELVTANLRTVPMYLDFGNFRPLGRMLEWSADLAAYVLMAVLHLPAEVALRVVAALAAAVLTGAAVVFAEAVTARGRMFAAPPSAPVALLPLALAGCLVAAGPFSTTVLFGGLYYLSAAVVLLIAAWIAPAPRRMWPVLLAGAALAAFNEVGALALPLATVAAAVRLWMTAQTCRTRPVDWAHPVTGWAESAESAESARPAHPVTGWAGLRPAAALWLGFLPVFLPVRALIFLACRDGNCYRSSELALGPGAAAALPDRLTAWLPPVQWFRALHGAPAPSRLAILAAVVIFSVVAARLLVQTRRLPELDRGQRVALAVAGLTVLVLGAALGSVNPQGQAAVAAGRWGLGWRDSGLTATGGAFVVLALLSRRALAAPLLALIAAVSMAANQAFAVHADQSRPAQVDNAIAASIAQFDDSAAGRTRRCALATRFAQVFPAAGYSRFAEGELPGTHSPADRLSVTASMATEQMYGRPFC